MSILLKNPDAERMARELADLRGSTLTDAIKGALAKALAEERTRRPTLEELREATRRFHAASGGLKPDRGPVTKQEWDELNATGFPEIDDA
ncbi:MAG TPA: type II toxin-antitoxin system VapB family antitoxin [Caulobacter sp.]|nr:type II toxin-antitoxin system VapB family antitoxin [Caulobacter sp.]